MYEIGIKYQNDKITHHRYDLIYPQFLQDKVDDDIVILEIGLGDNKNGTGKSNNFWKEYFNKSVLYIMDKDYEYNDGISVVLKGDQSNIEDLKRVKEIIGKCDLIVDDGSHQPEHQIKTFLYFFEHLLNDGGIYIIEDIECNYWNSKSTVYGYEIGHMSVINFLMSKIDSINSEFSKKNNSLKLSKITFAKNCIIIQKQTEEEKNNDLREYRFNNML